MIIYDTTMTQPDICRKALRKFACVLLNVIKYWFYLLEMANYDLAKARELIKTTSGHSVLQIASATGKIH